MITFYGRKSSDNVQKTLWMLLETGQPHQHIELGGKFGGLEDPEFLTLNPHGRVPVLVDDDVVVWESTAIIRYLAAAYSPGAIWPEEAGARAGVDKWMDWAQSRLYPEANRLFWRLIRTPEADQNAEKIAAGLEALNAHLEMVDDQLAGRAYLCGDQLTMADIIAGATLYRYYKMPIERPVLENVARWYETLSQRSAYRQAVMVPFDELKGRLAF
ncbi:MAG: glutathione S-transferase N-terminal domain-containing protein [Pseudomonadota bacterium]